MSSGSLPKRLSAKERIRQFFRSNIGTVVTSAQIRDASGASGGVTEWARRVRELRGEEGWPILTHHDSASLKPGEYMLESSPPEPSDVKFARAVSTKLRAEVLDRDGFTCQMCGLTPGDTDPTSGRKVRLHLGHIVDKSLGGANELSNFRALCSACNEGAKNVTGLKPSSIWLLSQIRRAGITEQREVFAWLRKKFE